MIALITGGNTGLGKAIYDHLIQHCKDVDIMPTEDLVEATKSCCLKPYIEKFIGDKKYDIVVNNFGINHLSWIGDTEEDDANILQANVMAPYWVINTLVANGAVATVVNVSSQTYKVAQRTTTLYCASKAAVVQMTKVMARELAPKGWVINAFAPGKILGTDMSRLTDAQVLELRGWSEADADDYATKLIPMGRFMDTKEAAEIVVKILQMPSYVNGTVIEAFGGL